jgi:hypothetical protein
VRCPASDDEHTDADGAGAWLVGSRGPGGSDVWSDVDVVVAADGGVPFEAPTPG